MKCKCNRRDAETAAEKKGTSIFDVRRGKFAEVETDPLSESVIGALIEVHRVLGPGLTEIMYEEAVCHELTLRGIPFARQVPIPVVYKGKTNGEGRLDLVVAGRPILELKSCEALTPVHRAQVITYLRLKRLQVALLVNFNVAILRDGIKRVVLTS